MTRLVTLAKELSPMLLMLLATGGSLLVATPSAGADPNSANCKPNRATCKTNGQCCSGVCTAGLCSASTPTTTSTTTTLAPTTTTTTSTTTTTVRFVDNMNGTVTDNQTGLQWEKKDNTCPGIHCVTDTYTWCVAGSDAFTCANGGVPDGPAFTSFLRMLNGGDTGVGNCTVSDADGSHEGGFAGHCDWRLPTIDELVTIFDSTQGNCVGGEGVCIDPTFAPTANEYWSSTTLARDSNVAWCFFFSTPGFTDENFKPGGTGSFSVRAVRGGQPD